MESVCNTKSDLELDVLDGMGSMVDKSLMRQIEQEDGEPRFVMLETIREYGLEKMAASGEEKLTRRAHAAYCIVLAEEGAAEDSAAKLTGWLERFEIENNNFRAALEWLTASGDAEWGLRIGGGAFSVLGGAGISGGRARAIGESAETSGSCGDNEWANASAFGGGNSGGGAGRFFCFERVVCGKPGGGAGVGRQAQHRGFGERAGD